MAWFKFSNAFFQSDLYETLCRKVPKTSPKLGGYALEALSLMATSLEFPIQRPNRATKSEQIVWDSLLECGALREVSGGYSAAAWLQEQDMLGKTMKTASLIAKFATTESAGTVADCATVEVEKKDEKRLTKKRNARNVESAKAPEPQKETCDGVSVLSKEKQAENFAKLRALMSGFGKA